MAMKLIRVSNAGAIYSSVFANIVLTQQKTSISIVGSHTHTYAHAPTFMSPTSFASETYGLGACRRTFFSSNAETNESIKSNQTAKCHTINSIQRNETKLDGTIYYIYFEQQQQKAAAFIIRGFPPINLNWSVPIIWKPVFAGLHEWKPDLTWTSLTVAEWSNLDCGDWVGEKGNFADFNYIMRARTIQ